MEASGDAQVQQALAESTDDDEFLTAESSDTCNGESLLDDISSNKSLTSISELFLSSTKLSIPKFNHGYKQLCLCPFFSDSDYCKYSLVPNSSCIGLLLIPKHRSKRPGIEYVSLTHQNQSNVSILTFLNSQNFEVIQSCNGLLLCRSVLDQSYCICNSKTQQFKVLPGTSYMRNQFVLNLAFDPQESPHYKVICIQKLFSQKPLHQIAIYSSETCGWCPSGESFIALGDINFQDGVFCNGSIHWMKGSSNGLYFDVNKECLAAMPNPPLREGYSYKCCEYFGQSQGFLHYVLGLPDLHYYEVFEMEKDYSGWTLKFRIDLRAVATEFPIVARNLDNPNPFFPRYECDVLSIARGQSDNQFEVFLSIPNQVIAYKPEKNYARKVCNLTWLPQDLNVCQVVAKQSDFTLVS